MFNTVARVAGVAVLGGIALFAGYSYTTDRSTTAADSAAAEQGTFDVSQPRQSRFPDVSGTANQDVGTQETSRSGVPAGTEPIAFAEGQSGETVAPTGLSDDDLFSTAPLPDAAESDLQPSASVLGNMSTPLADEAALVEMANRADAPDPDMIAGDLTAADLAEEERLARLGNGGLLDAPISNAAEGVETATVATAAAISGIADKATDAASQGAASAAAATTIAAAQASEAGQSFEAGQAGQFSEAGQAGQASEAGQASPGLRGLPADTQGDVAAKDMRGANDFDAVVAAANAAPNAPPNAAGQPQMIRNTRQPGKKVGEKGMIRNAARAAKPDGTPFFTANAAQIDKPDEGAYFTTNTDGADPQNPCLKADGTPYVGPGVALNPFAAGNPCLPRATAQSYDVAGSPTLPIASDVFTSTPFIGLPRPVGFFDSKVPLPPSGGNFGSSYRAL